MHHDNHDNIADTWIEVEKIVAGDIVVFEVPLYGILYRHEVVSTDLNSFCHSFSRGLNAIDEFKRVYIARYFTDYPIIHISERRVGGGVLKEINSVRLMIEGKSPIISNQSKLKLFDDKIVLRMGISPLKNHVETEMTPYEQEVIRYLRSLDKTMKDVARTLQLRLE